MGIEKLFPQSSNEVFPRILCFAQSWRIRLKEQDTIFWNTGYKKNEEMADVLREVNLNLCVGVL
jgi:hypothetical protein